MERGNLVLTVFPGQPVEIGEGVTVTYVGGAGHGRAWLVISAPPDVHIRRGQRQPRRSAERRERER